MKRIVSWLLLPVLIAAVSSCSSNTPLDGTEEERAYDVLQLNGKWEQIVEKNFHEPTHSLACRKVVRLAQYRLGQAGQDAVFECLSDSHDALSSELAAMMVKHADVTDCERPLRRLTETALITGQYELALKYIAIVEQHFSSADWVQTMRTLAMHPEQISQHPVFSKLRENYEKTQDQFFM